MGEYCLRGESIVKGVEPMPLGDHEPKPRDINIGNV